MSHASPIHTHHPQHELCPHEWKHYIAYTANIYDLFCSHLPVYIHYVVHIANTDDFISFLHSCMHTLYGTHCKYKYRHSIYHLRYM